MRVVVGVADVEHRVQQLFLGCEVMQQAGGAHAGLAGDLGKGRAAPPVTGQQPLRNGQDPLLAVFALGPQGIVRPCIRHRTPSSNQPSEHTVGLFLALYQTRKNLDRTEPWAASYLVSHGSLGPAPRALYSLS